MPRVVVAGYMLRLPTPGNIFAYFHYVLGLHRLGYEVAYVEESGWFYSSYDPDLRSAVEFPTRGLEIVRGLMAEHGVEAPVWFVERDSGRVDGGTRGELRDLLAETDLLINVGGVCWLDEFTLCRRRALIDMDPMFTQCGEFASDLLDDHDVHFTYGANIGRPGCRVPPGGRSWIPTAPPVVADLWEGRPAPGAPFTTVTNWSAYEPIEHEGERYGQKGEQFERLMELPSRTSQPLELALGGAGDAAATLEQAGWRVRDAADLSAIDDYRAYLTTSRGEFSAAKHAYVHSRSGWFSDRSVCYLAAGLPVILEDTGFTDWLPAGAGVLAFTTVEEAARCIERVNSDYDAHRRAAAELARDRFSHEVVLPRLVDRSLDAAGRQPA